MVDRSKTGKRSRTKGHNWERDIVKLAKAADIPAVRMWQYRGEEEGGPDVYIYAQKRGGRVLQDGPSPTMAIECKCRMNFSSAQICELLKVQPDNLLDAVAVKIDHKGSFVAMRVEDFIDLLKAAE